MLKKQPLLLFHVLLPSDKTDQGKPIGMTLVLRCDECPRASTDDEGRFVFQGVPVGKYTIGLGAEYNEATMTEGNTLTLHGKILVFSKEDGVRRDLGRVASGARNIVEQAPPAKPEPSQEQGDLAQRGCDAANASECKRLASMYAEGKGVAKDLARAAALYEKACDAGDAASCFTGMIYYLRGEGVSKDPARAAKLSQRGIALARQGRSQDAPPASTTSPPRTVEQFVITDSGFVDRSNPYCQGSSDVAISDSGAHSWGISKPPGKPSATLAFCNGRQALWSPGSTHTWLGKTEAFGYVFDSSKDDPLQFRSDRDLGYVYVRGTGTVRTPEGKLVNLPLVATGGSAGPARSSKQVILIYVADNAPVPNQDLWLSYYDESTRAWNTANKKTSATGAAEFNVPSGAGGESAGFTFAFSESELKSRTSEVQDGKLLGLRIPPAPQQPKLTLKVGRDFRVENVEGAMQAWGPK